MGTFNRRKFFYQFLVFGLIAMSAGCQLLHRMPPEEAVRLRIEAFMNARVGKDFATAYTFFAEEYQERISARQYERKAGKVEVSGYSIESIRVEDRGDQAVAVVKTDVTMQGMDFKGNPETQIWVREKGGWFLHIPEKDPKDFFK